MSDGCSSCLSINEVDRAGDYNRWSRRRVGFFGFNGIRRRRALFSIVAIREEGSPSTDSVEAEETDTPSAPPIVVTGTINLVNAEAGTATITHGPMTEIGMPGMTMDFPLEPTLDTSMLEVGSEMTLTFARADGMTMVLAEATPIAPPLQVSGRINSIDANARTANVTHGPMTEIGMPGMTMDFPVAEGIEVSNLPVGIDVSLILRRNPDFSMTLLEVALDGSVTQ